MGSSRTRRRPWAEHVRRVRPTSACLECAPRDRAPSVRSECAPSARAPKVLRVSGRPECAPRIWSLLQKDTFSDPETYLTWRRLADRQPLQVREAFLQRARAGAEAAVARRVGAETTEADATLHLPPCTGTSSPCDEHKQSILPILCVRSSSFRWRARGREPTRSRGLVYRLGDAHRSKTTTLSSPPCPARGESKQTVPNLAMSGPIEIARGCLEPSHILLKSPVNRQRSGWPKSGQHLWNSKFALKLVSKKGHILWKSPFMWSTVDRGWPHSSQSGPKSLEK